MVNRETTGEQGRVKLPDTVCTTQCHEAEHCLKSDIMLADKENNNGMQNLILVLNYIHVPLDHRRSQSIEIIKKWKNCCTSYSEIQKKWGMLCIFIINFSEWRAEVEDVQMWFFDIIQNGYFR